MNTQIGVADVLAVRTGGWGAWAIRFGAWLRGLPHTDNHIVIAHHQDAAGIWWGIEGRPGGVGWVDMRGYLTSPATVDNREQPKTDAQRATVADAMVAAIGTPYDWAGIAADAAHDLDLPTLFAQDWHGQGAPGHVVCSSLADWGYQHADLPHPDPHDGGRFVQPADWAAFDIAKRWI